MISCGDGADLFVPAFVFELSTAAAAGSKGKEEEAEEEEEEKVEDERGTP